MKNYPTEEQIQTLRERLRGHHLEAVITLGIVTGMRRDELLRLTWPEIDLEKREILVWNSKTKSSSRLIHLPEECVQILRQHHPRQMKQCAEADTMSPHLDLIFPDHAGGLLSAQSFLEQWYAFLDQVGLPRLGFHRLRMLVWQRLHEQLHEARAHEGAQNEAHDLNKSTDRH